MAKYARREDLVTNTFAFKMFNKRLCDLNSEEKREYYRIRKQVSREKDIIKESERIYRARCWSKLKEEMMKCQNQN